MQCRWVVCTDSHELKLLVHTAKYNAVYIVVCLSKASNIFSLPQAVKPLRLFPPRKLDLKDTRYLKSMIILTKILRFYNKMSVSVTSAYSGAEMLQALTKSVLEALLSDQFEMFTTFLSLIRESSWQSRNHFIEAIEWFLYEGAITIQKITKWPCPARRKALCHCWPRNALPKSEQELQFFLWLSKSICKDTDGQRHCSIQFFRLRLALGVLNVMINNENVPPGAILPSWGRSMKSRHALCLISFHYHYWSYAEVALGKIMSGHFRLKHVISRFASDLGCIVRLFLTLVQIGSNGCLAIYLILRAYSTPKPSNGSITP